MQALAAMSDSMLLLFALVMSLLGLYALDWHRGLFILNYYKIGVVDEKEVPERLPSAGTEGGV